MQEKIIILDFGSQTTQLIARRVRELNTYCEIVPYNKFPHNDPSIIGVILSGSPFSVYDESAIGYYRNLQEKGYFNRMIAGRSEERRVGKEC